MEHSATRASVEFCHTPELFLQTADLVYEFLPLQELILSGRFATCRSTSSAWAALIIASATRQRLIPDALEERGAITNSTLTVTWGSAVKDVLGGFSCEAHNVVINVVDDVSVDGAPMSCLDMRLRLMCPGVTVRLPVDKRVMGRFHVSSCCHGTLLDLSALPQVIKGFASEFSTTDIRAKVTKGCAFHCQTINIDWHSVLAELEGFAKPSYGVSKHFSVLVRTTSRADAEEAALARGFWLQSAGVYQKRTDRQSLTLVTYVRNTVSVVLAF
ncbi:hypothetical protein JKP88DRAFT_240970 [Tribonema minus]|uniref:Uncharacterized protein n=1 Tax=Tribonema minus TaxID=303371 RepID=A0A835YZI7_9STRA|nr:hypothetical protein JKP88DRAFT_255962 [Tribonema minus]KAG5186369.1 hypothetical protein JKP88DRAFT_240970 [Tribonema minus]